MIEKIPIDQEPFKMTDKIEDTLNRLYIIAEKVNEIIEIVNLLQILCVGGRDLETVVRQNFLK